MLQKMRNSLWHLRMIAESGHASAQTNSNLLCEVSEVVIYYIFVTELVTIGDSGFRLSFHVSYFSLPQFIMLGSLHWKFENDVIKTDRQSLARINCQI